MKIATGAPVAVDGAAVADGSNETMHDDERQTGYGVHLALPTDSAE